MKISLKICFPKLAKDVLIDQLEASSILSFFCVVSSLGSEIDKWKGNKDSQAW
jgi:hypothetical protein